MSKNIVDCICELPNNSVGLIPSRRQIEHDGGYVNNWTTNQFTTYVRCKNPNIVIQRDHGGPSQGKTLDDGLLSFKNDCQNGFDSIHIDPWKKLQDIDTGIKKTADLINYCYEVNPNCRYEIGTEQAIREFSVQELDKIFGDVKKLVGNKFANVKYGVIQGGTSIVGTKNTGVFEEKKFKDMIEVCKKYDLLSKEHNGDYLTKEEVSTRFHLGLDSLNIAPEFGFIETKTVLEEILNNQEEELFERFFKLCYKSNKWKKWVNKNFYLTEFKKHVIIRIAGHYVFSDPNFLLIKKQMPNIETKIKENINKRIHEVLCAIK